LKKKLTHNNRVGILGGTFDPPHSGHLHISKIIIKELKLKSLTWIITKQNPFKKKPYLSESKRIILSKKILAKEKKIFVKIQDNNLQSKSTFDLLYYLKKKNKSLNFYFIIGSDNLIQFHKWKNWKKISSLAKIVVFPRSGYILKAFKSVAAKKLKKEDLIHINAKKINISSSLIRKYW